MRELSCHSILETTTKEVEKYLRPHQVRPVRDLIGIFQKFQVAVDWSSTGTGKTAVAVAVAKILSLPTLIVTPHIIQTAWKEMGHLFEDSFSVCNYELLRTGNTPFGWWDRPKTKSQFIFVCLNCQRKYKPEITPDACYCRPDKIHCFETKKIPHKYGRFNFHPGVKFLIMDECHRCGGIDSLNADMLIAAKRQGIKILLLSATPAASPLDLRALGYALDLHNLTDYYSWMMRLGVRRLPVGGWRWEIARQRQLETMAEIRSRVIPAKGVRVTTESIPDFPSVEIEAQLYDIDNSANIQKIYEEMAESLTELKTRAENDKNADHALTMLLRGRQKIELLKTPLMVELCQDFRAKGFSVALFVNFSQTVAELRKRLKCDCFVDGSREGVRLREDNIRNFQENSAREIILQIDAGKEALSLHDKHGEFPRVGLAMPTFSAKAVRQLVGRLPRTGGKSTSYYRFLFARGTVEVSMHRALVGKLNNMDALNDADLYPENLQFAGLTLRWRLCNLSA